MANHDMQTSAPDRGLRIKTEVTAKSGLASEGSGAPDIVCRAVNLAYGDNHTLHDITMDIDDRRVTALIGPSGCGKSTLLRCFNRMNDLIDNVRIWGEIKVKGLDINAPATDVIEVRRRVGMVFQKSNPFPKSIFENVVYGLRIAGINDKATLDEACERSLKGAALWDEVKDRLGDSGLGLSGGQMQRLCIARAMHTRCICPPERPRPLPASRSLTSSQRAAPLRLLSQASSRVALSLIPAMRRP